MRRAQLTYPSAFYHVLNRSIRGESKNPRSLFIAYSPVNLYTGFEYGRDERIAFVEIFRTVRQWIDAFIN
jgi:hypothetical protein